MKTLHVSCAAEGRYVAHSAAMIHSVLSQRGRLAVRVHYLHGTGFDQQDADRLARMVEMENCSISFIEVADHLLAGLPADPRFTSAMWYRLFLPELIPTLPRVLYLDADTLACASLEPLWRTDLTGWWLAAVNNAFQPNHRGRPKKLGLARDAYFNSGVLLMNLDEMRRDAVTARLLEIVGDRSSDLEWPDQDALNLALGERRLRLHPRWNAMNALRQTWSKGTFSRLARRRALRWPRIRHFEGPGSNKPWDPECQELQRSIYWAHLRQTPWTDVTGSTEQPPAGCSRSS